MKINTIKKMSLLLTMMLGLGALKADHLADRLTFSARLTPAPGVSTTGNGVGAFMLNSNRDTMYFTTSVAKLSSALNGFHIHNARTGGNVIFDFHHQVDGNTVRGFITGTDLNPRLIADFMEGNLYLAVHTVNNPAVEILGFIKLETDWGFAATINGAQATTNSMAMGHAAISFGLKGDTAVVRAVTNLTNPITAVHLHYGKMGQNGGVALGLDNLISANGTSLNGGVTINGVTWTNLMAALMNDSVYINFHTSAFPNGEIRGQLSTTKTLRFDSYLTSAAITAGGGSLTTPSNGNGVSTLSLNNSMDTLTYQVFFNGLTSNAVAAHFHLGEPNQSGGVVKELTISGNMISGVWTKYDAASPLNNLLISELLKGNLYYAVHTTNNPNGEIRGQVYRLAREGFIAEVNGVQANTNSMAKGTAIASYDRNRTNLHSMVAVDGLQGTIESGHIHFGKKGEMGGVAIDLDPFTNNGSYLYANNNNGFNDLTSKAMRRNDSTYVNIHTSAFANGEIRGQLMRNYRISTLSSSPTSVANANSNTTKSLTVYPNPTVGELNISINSSVNQTASIVIYDLNGKVTLTQTAQLSIGNNLVTLNTENLNKGLFVVELQLTNELVSRTKIMKN